MARNKTSRRNWMIGTGSSMAAAALRLPAYNLTAMQGRLLLQAAAQEIGRASCRERDWSSDVCSSDLSQGGAHPHGPPGPGNEPQFLSRGIDRWQETRPRGEIG